MEVDRPDLRASDIVGRNPSPRPAYFCHEPQMDNPDRDTNGRRMRKNELPFDSLQQLCLFGGRRN
jgi:hypothetical protein